MFCESSFLGVWKFEKDDSCNELSLYSFIIVSSFARRHICNTFLRQFGHQFLNRKE